MPVIVATIFVLPLSLAKELKQLRYLCLLSFFFVIFLCFVVFQESFTYQPFSHSIKSINQFTFGGLSTTFPTAVFSYMSHSNVLDVFGVYYPHPFKPLHGQELKNPTQKRMKKVVLWTIILVFITYVIVGSFGYITFAGNMEALADVNKANGVILLAYHYGPEGELQPYPTQVIMVR